MVVGSLLSCRFPGPADRGDCTWGGGMRAWGSRAVVLSDAKDLHLLFQDDNLVFAVRSILVFVPLQRL